MATAPSRALEPVVPKVSKLAQDLAALYYFENLAANAAKRTADKARKDLQGEMEREDLKSFVYIAHSPTTGNPVTLEVELTQARATDKVDVEALAKLVPLTQLLPLLSLGKEAAIAAFGEALVSQVLQSQPGKDTVMVKPAK